MFTESKYTKLGWVVWQSNRLWQNGIKSPSHTHVWWCSCEWGHVWSHKREVPRMIWKLFGSPKYNGSCQKKNDAPAHGRANYIWAMISKNKVLAQISTKCVLTIFETSIILLINCLNITTLCHSFDTFYEIPKRYVQIRHFMAFQ